jgi:hypothetical protein
MPPEKQVRSVATTTLSSFSRNLADVMYFTVTLSMGVKVTFFISIADVELQKLM